MNDLQGSKMVMMLPPQLKNDGDFAGNTYVDTLGHSFLQVIFITGTTDAAVGSTDEATAPLLEECDTTGGEYTAITDAALGAVIGADDDDTVKVIELNLAKSHKRYVRVQTPHAADGTTGANLAIIGCLSNASGNAPITATERGIDELVQA